MHNRINLRGFWHLSEKVKIATVMTSYSIHLRLTIYIIQWADYYKDHCEPGLKGSDFWTAVFTMVWWEFLFYRISKHF